LGLLRSLSGHSGIQCLHTRRFFAAAYRLRLRAMLFDLSQMCRRLFLRVMANAQNKGQAI
jgi:hypothetical protein